MSALEKVNFDNDGLIPAVLQDEKTGEVLMVAYMDRQALQKTLETKRAWFYSRKRKTLWQKGETSGHFQEVREIFYDCDGDTLLLKVDPKGPACHTGNKTCFYRKLLPMDEKEVSAGRIAGEMKNKENTEARQEVQKNSKNREKITYILREREACDFNIIEDLISIIDSRFKNLPENSYVATLYKGGKEKILKKVGEEASEVIIASMSGKRGDTVYEAADLIFHLLVALRFDCISIEEILEELKRRRK